MYDNIIITVIIYFSLEPGIQDWNVTRLIYKPNESATHKPVPAPQVGSQSLSQLEDHIRKFSNLLDPTRSQPRQATRSQSPSLDHTSHTSVPDQSSVNQSSELLKAKKRAGDMEKRAIEAEQNLSAALQQLVQANDKIAALKAMVEEAQQKAAVVQQRVHGQLTNATAGSLPADENNNYSSALERALDAEKLATAVKIQFTQAEEKISSMEVKLTKANETILHLQEELSATEERASQAQQCATQAEQRVAEAEQRAEELRCAMAQMEIRAIGAEAQASQAERSARLSQDQALNSEIRAREEERRRIDAEQQVRDANTRREQAERRAAFVDRGEERMWALERDEITLTDAELGRGGWAVVKVAQFRGIRVAAKCMYNNILSDHNRALFVREMNMAARLRHPNLVQFIGATIHGEPLILMELMPTTLRIELQHGPPNRDQVLAISKDVANALNYMHLMKPDPLIHRDVSSANVLLERSSNSSWKVKLSDYGSVNFVQRTVSAGPGNPSYAAPEANNPDLHSPKMDVFSYGVLLSEMCSGRFPDANHTVLVERVQDRQMARLVRCCMANEPDRRPSMSDILATI